MRQLRLLRFFAQLSQLSQKSHAISPKRLDNLLKNVYTFLNLLTLILI